MLIESGAIVVALDIPADFHEVPLDAETPQRTAAQMQVLDDMELADQRQREALSLYLEALAIRLSRSQVAGTAFCAVQIAGRPSTATLTVGVVPTHTTHQGLAVMGAAEVMRREQRYAAVEILELGQLPAVTARLERPSLPGDVATGDVGATLRELSAFVPVPGQDRAAMVTLSTPCLEDWDVYVGAVLNICRTVRVHLPEVAGVTGARAGLTR